MSTFYPVAAGSTIRITVEPYSHPISYHGKYYYRSGSTNRELTGRALDEFILRKQGKTWDSVPVPHVKVADLDLQAFREFRRMALSSKRLNEQDLALSDEALVDSLLLAEGKYLKRAAILLFHNNPEKWANGAYVKMGYFETGSDLKFQDEVHGPLITMADKVIDILYAKYFKALIRYEGIIRVEEYPVPKNAFREAVLNAIVHRDYSSGIPVQIKVFPDEVIIYNDGGLPEGWTIDDLLSRHISLPHNPNIARAFFRSGQIETWGRGIEKIEEACREDGRPLPTFKTSGPGIMVTFSTPDSVGAVEASGNGSERIVEEMEGSEWASELNSDQRMILSLMFANPRITTRLIAGETGLTPKAVEGRIKRLKKAGLVERVGSDKKGSWKVNPAATASGLGGKDGENEEVTRDAAPPAGEASKKVKPKSVRAIPVSKGKPKQGKRKLPP